MADKQSVRVRAITVLLGLDNDRTNWPSAVATAAGFLKNAQQSLQALGFEIQTVRIATNSWTEYVTKGRELQDIQALERLCLDAGVSFLAIGGSACPQDLDAVIVPVATQCQYTSASFHLPQMVSRATAGLDAGGLAVHASARTIYDACARAILDISDLTGGEGNFRFCASANCQPGIPCFPAASAFSIHTVADGSPSASPNDDLKPSQPAPATTASPSSLSSHAQETETARFHTVGVQCFGVGLENDTLLHLAACRASASGATTWDISRHVHDAMLATLQKVSSVCTELADSTGVPFLGIDTSIVPGLDTPSVTESFRLLSGAAFSRPGTLAACAAVTQALKALPVRQCGYRGMMLPVCEDAGLAVAAAEGTLDMQVLLACSSVCGVGLDTVPVPGRCGDVEQDAALEQAIALLMMDVSSLAYRLDKPLSCRLLPQPNKRPGQDTTFVSPYLINSRVMRVD